MKQDEKPMKVDLNKLSATDSNFVKLIEAQNLERVRKLKALRSRNLLTAGIIGTGVLSIYAYSMLAVRQETFLDDFEEPQKTTQ